MRGRFELRREADDGNRAEWILGITTEADRQIT